MPDSALARHAAVPARARPHGRPRSPRKVLYGWHSWAGFHLFLLTFVVLFTGTLAVVSNEIDWLLDENRRITPSANAPDWEAMYQNVRAIAGGDELVTLTLGELNVMAAEAWLLGKNDRRYRVFMDPASGEITGVGSWFNTQRLLRDFHRYLFMASYGLGLPIVTLSALVLAVQLVSGLMITRRWLRSAVTAPRRRNARVLIGDLHRLGALWTVWFTLLTVLTGLWYFAEWMIHRSGGRAAAPTQAVTAPAAAQITRPDSIAQHLRAVQAAYPELRISTINLPTVSRDQLLFTGPSTDWLLRDRASRVTVDANTADVLAVQRPADLSAVEYVADLADPWHFGDVGGLATKLLWFVCGLLLSGLSATGVWLTWTRTRQGISRWQLASSGVLLLSLAFGFRYLHHYLG